MLTQVRSTLVNGFKASDMAAEKSSSGTVQHMSVTGISAMPVATESLRTHKVRVMKASSSITCVTEKASTFIRIVTSKMDNGSKISKMESALSIGQIVLNLEETTWMVKRRALECGNGQTGRSTKETGMTIR